MKKAISLLFFVLFVLSVCGQSKMSPYTSMFIDTHRRALQDTAANSFLKKEFKLKMINSEEYVDCFIRLKNESVIGELESLGVLVNRILPTLVTAQIPVAELENVANLNDVVKVELGLPVRKKMDNARSLANVDYVHQGVDLPAYFKGSGTVVGVIDGGFEYGHINFYDSTRTTLRVKRVWNQNASGTRPSGFSYGAEYATEANILTAKEDYSDETHATHVTGIAAGAFSGRNYYGVAPEADIVMVSYSDSRSTGILDGVKYIYNYAESVGKPAVVNMSLGQHIGPHDGTSTFDQACDALQGSGKLLVGAAGNEGGDNLHISKTFAENDTLKSFFNFIYGTYGIYSGYTDIWGDVNKGMKVQVVVYKRSTNAIVYQSAFIDATAENSESITLTNASTQGARGYISIQTEKNSDNNKANAFIQLQLTALTSGNYVGIRIVSEAGATVHAWADDYYTTFANNSITGWTTGNSNYSVGEIGGSGNRIITVGAYTSKNRFSNMSGGTYSTGETLNSITDFSSIGPTIDGRMKPDITAPGSILVSSFNSSVVSSQDYSSYVSSRDSVNGKAYYFGSMQGTSMASPFVTGVLATWLGVDPTLTPELVRSILQETAIRDNYTGAIAQTGSNTWGYGKIDAWAGIKKVISSLTDIADINVDENLLLYPNPISFTSTSPEIMFKYDDKNVVVRLFSLNGQILMNNSIGTVNYRDKITLDNLSSITPGMYLLYIKGDNKSFGRKLIIE